LQILVGLIPGAHAGLGLGNKFLDDLRHADVFLHVIDASGTTNEKVPSGRRKKKCTDSSF
jgi:ribosome-binding ATPase YchF (GTP1/OBG family)